MTVKLLSGSNGRLLLAGGRPLSVSPGGSAGGGGTPDSIQLVPWEVINPSTGSRFQVHTTSASNDTLGNVPVLFNYSGQAPTSVQARIVGETGNVVKDWTDITYTARAFDGACLAYLDGVPAGIRYKREIRTAPSGGLQTADASYFNVGIMVLPWGQSNMVGTLNGNVGNGNIVPGTSMSELTYFLTMNFGTHFGTRGFVGANNADAYSSAGPADGGQLSIMRMIGTLMENKLGRKIGIGLNSLALNGTSIQTFFIDPVNLKGLKMLDASGTNPSAVDIGFSSPEDYTSGDYRLVAWHQGETSETNITRTKRKEDLKAFCQAHIDHVAKYGRPPNKLTFLFAYLGVYGLGGTGLPNVPHVEVLRQAVDDLIADPYVIGQGWDVRLGWSCIDLDPVAMQDSLHMQGDDKRRSNRRMLQSMMSVLDPVAVPYSGRGPRLTKAYTRSGDDVTLTVAHEGGTALAPKTAGSAITGWYANTAADFSGTDIPLTNVTIVDATHIRVTATGAPTTFYIKHCGNKLYTALSYHPDVSNLVYDNFVYPTGANAGDQFTGLPLQPTPDAIQVG